MTSLNLEKCDLSLTPLAGICKENLWLCQAPFAFTFIFILLYKISERMTLLLVSTQALAGQNNIGFSSKGYILKTVKKIHTISVCAGSTRRSWKDRTRPTEVFHCVRPIAGHTASRQDAHGLGCLCSGDANKIKGAGQ